MECRIFYETKMVPYEEILNLIHMAFKERVENNIQFTVASFSLDDLKEHTQNGCFITMWDGHLLVGSVTLNRKKKKNLKYGSQDHLAVHPDYKRKGIGRMLLKNLIEVAKKEKMPFVTSTTSVKAISSVNWHKKNGFKILKYDSYYNTNYYSYWFIKPIDGNLLISVVLLFRLPIFFLSYIICKIKKNENGKKRFREKSL